MKEIGDQSTSNMNMHLATGMLPGRIEVKRQATNFTKLAAFLIHANAFCPSFTPHLIFPYAVRPRSKCLERL